MEMIKLWDSIWDKNWFKRKEDNDKSLSETSLEEHIETADNINEKQHQNLSKSETIINEKIADLASDLEITNLMSIPKSCYELWQHGVTTSKGPCIYYIITWEEWGEKLQISTYQ